MNGGYDWGILLGPSSQMMDMIGIRLVNILGTINHLMDMIG